MHDLWIAVKFPSSPDLAGTPRNTSRASLKVERSGGRALNVLGGFAPTDDYHTPKAVFFLLSGSQTVGDKIHGREGNSPDRRLRSPNVG